MRSYSLVLILLISFSIQGMAQVKPFRFGVQLSPNLAWIAPDSKNYENNGVVAGFAWGFQSDITLTDNYFIKTGFNLEYLNGKLTYPEKIKLTEGEDTYTEGTLNRKYNLRYLEIPLSIKMRTNTFGKTAYFGEIGFGTSFNLKARAKDDFNYDNGQNNLLTEDDIKSQVVFLRSSLKVGAGIEYFIDESTSMTIGITFNNGLTNILKGENSIDPDVDQRAQLYYFQLNVGILF
ncbi:MAG: PorT family protein [Bacteroidales bacterium]|nr:PorT family protein [Bacteroidales bacterium]